MSGLRYLIGCGVGLMLATAAQAGLHYSGEPIGELPSQWRGFLLDHKALRSIGMQATPGDPASPMRVRYFEEAAKLEKKNKLTADDLADLGAIYVRLGELPKALGVLRAAQLEHPNHFAIAANLGTAWQLAGDLQQAAVCLEQAVRLAPGKLQKTEEYHLKLVRFRLLKKGTAELDDLFGIRFVNDKGEYEPGKLAAAERKKLPESSVAVVQQLALWLPGDGRLLWQLAELANVCEDYKYAAAMMEGCVTQMGVNSAVLRKNKTLTKIAAEEQAKLFAASGKADHMEHSGLKAKSKRPLVSRIELKDLPPISATAVNAMPWALLAETTVDKKFRPTFMKYLQELDGKLVTLAGFMQPLSEELDVAAFMLIEYPVGCWYCDMPDTTQIIFVELPKGKSTTYTRTMVKVTGRLVLNSTDPEEFLYTLRNAKVHEVD